jgi:hypothetical protein
MANACGLCGFVALKSIATCMAMHLGHNRRAPLPRSDVGGRERSGKTVLEFWLLPSAKSAQDSCHIY